MGNRKFIKISVVALFISALALLIVSNCSANQWMLFHDKEIKGSVIDVETSKPIEGAIVIGMWALTQIPGEGFGGYAKIQVATTDSAGNFIIPSWTTFKPWKFNSVIHELAPKIVIYKPGYKLYLSTKIVRDGYPDHYELTEEDKKKIKEKYSLTPAKLKRIYTDEERAKNLEMVETEGRLFDLIENLDKKDSILLIKAIKEEYLLLPQDRKERFKYIDKIEEHLPGGKK